MSSRGKRGRPAHNDVLTPAEWRTVHAVRHGLSNRGIAERRGISVDGVKYHVGNVLAKLGLTGRGELRLWHGAPRASALRHRERTVSEQATLGPIGQIARSVADIEQSVAWYRDVLGLEHLYTFGQLAFFDCAGTRLMLSQSDGAHASESILYLRTGDIQASHADLAERGVEFINAPHMIHRHEDGTEEWMAFFKDPEERPLALMSQVEPA